MSNRERKAGKPRKTLMLGVAGGGVLALGGLSVVSATQSAGQLQGQVQRAVESIEATGLVSVEQEPYQRTLLGGTQVTRLILDAGGQEPRTVRVVSRVTNGPFPGLTSFGVARVDTHLEFPPELQEPVHRAMGGQQPTIRTLVRFGGGSTSIVNVPAGQYQDADGALSWKALSGILHSDGDRLRVNLTWPGATFSSDGTTVQLGATKLASDSLTRERGLGTGSSSMTVDEFSVTSDGESVLGRQLLVSSDIGEQAGAYQLGVKYELGEASAGGKTLKDLKLHAGARQLDVPTLDALVETVNAMSAAERRADAAEQARLQSQALDQLQALLRASPEVTLDRLSVGGAQGEVLLSARLGLTDAASIDLSGAPFALLPHLAVDGTLNGAEAAVKGLLRDLAGPELGGDPDAMVNMLVEQSLLRREGSDLRAELRLDAAGLSVNGQPMPLF